MNLKGRNFLTLKDFTKEEIQYLVSLAAELKAKKKQGVLVDTLRGKNIALIFEKTSTRTRCSFETAAHDLGMGKMCIRDRWRNIPRKTVWHLKKKCLEFTSADTRWKNMRSGGARIFPQ